MTSLAHLSGNIERSQTDVVFPDFLNSRKGKYELLLHEFIQLELHVVDTVPAGTGVMQVLL